MVKCTLLMDLLPAQMFCRTAAVRHSYRLWWEPRRCGSCDRTSHHPPDVFNSSRNTLVYVVILSYLCSQGLTHVSVCTGRGRHRATETFLSDQLQISERGQERSALYHRLSSLQTTQSTFTLCHINTFIHWWSPFYSQGVKYLRFLTSFGVWYQGTWLPLTSLFNVKSRPIINNRKEGGWGGQAGLKLNFHPGDQSLHPMWNKKSTVIVFG